MKQFYQKTLVLFLFLLTVTGATAYQFSVDGIYYNINEGNAVVTYPNGSMYSSTSSSYTGEINIPSRIVWNNTTYDVTEIGSYAFHKSSVTKVTLPSSIVKISIDAFYGCTQLASINLPDNVTIIERDAFYGCTALTEPLYNRNIFVYMPVSACGQSYTIQEGIKEIYESAFAGCSSLTKITFPKSLKTIGTYSFRGCTGLREFTITDSINYVGYSAFYECSNLTRIIINSEAFAAIDRQSTTQSLNSLFPLATEFILGDNVTAIGDYTFADCKGISTLTLPSRLKRIGQMAFMGCVGLKKLNLPESVNTIGQNAFFNLTNLTEPIYNTKLFARLPISYSGSYTVPSGITTICSHAFNQCEGLKTVMMPDGLLTIGERAFAGSGITKADIPESVDSMYSEAFEGCKDLVEVTVPKLHYSWSRLFANCNNLKIVTILPAFYVGSYWFQNCTSLESVTIPVETIDYGAFSGCTSLSNIEIENVKKIGNNAFQGCVKLDSVNIPDDISSIGYNAFPTNTKPYVNKGKKSNLYFWREGITVYDRSTGNELLPPALRCLSTTQTTATLKIDNYYPEFKYHRVEGFYFYEEIEGDEIVANGLMPGSEQILKPVYIKYGNSTSPAFMPAVTVTTKNLLQDVKEVAKTASSLTVVGSYIKGDANVTSCKMKVNGEVHEGDSVCITGLDPNTPYTIEYSVMIDEKTECKGTSIHTTSSLVLTTQQPKVASPGNVIVAAVANLDDEETNAGFEWRRTDWTEDFESNKGNAYLFGGMMEGYIRNLNTNYLWKFRPYYTSNSGKTYYGDWAGLDPTNTSYFEPTVHTYAQIGVEGNTVNVKGYVMRGSDNIIQQGFKYWKVSAGVRGASGQGIPSDVVTVEAEGNVMTVQLTGLDYESEYAFVAFVKTSENETFYGEQQTFRTGPDTSGVEDVTVANGEVVETARFNLKGHRLNAPRRGLNIIRMSDGTVRKVMVK